MIETITLRNYKGHVDTVVPCQRLTVLVGENATGKTSVLEGIANAREFISTEEPDPKEIWQGRRKQASSVSILVIGQGGEHHGSVEISIASETEGNATLQLDGFPSVMLWNKEIHPSDSAYEFVNLVFPDPTWLSLESQEIARASKPESIDPKPESSGLGLPSALAHLKLSDTERFARIIEHLRSVVPIVEGIRFARVEEKKRTLRKVRVEGQMVTVPATVRSIADTLRFDFIDAKDVPADIVSEGTLLALGIITALEYAEGPQLVLIDDLDRALHPRAQRALIATLRAILASRPSLQILATSHSPYLVDALQPEEVVILGRDKKNVIVAKRLDTFPDERLRKMLSTGELWLSEGEDWVKK